MRNSLDKDSQKMTFVCKAMKIFASKKLEILLNLCNILIS